MPSKIVTSLKLFRRNYRTIELDFRKGNAFSRLAAIYISPYFGLIPGSFVGEATSFLTMLRHQSDIRINGDYFNAINHDKLVDLYRNAEKHKFYFDGKFIDHRLLTFFLKKQSDEVYYVCLKKRKETLNLIRIEIFPYSSINNSTRIDIRYLKDFEQVSTTLDDDGIYYVNKFLSTYQIS